MNCLKGCVNQFHNKKRGVKLPLNDNIIMPWVVVKIAGAKKTSNGVTFQSTNDQFISVSNYSSNVNHAVIKSFQFGMSNGAGVLIEVVDEDGGNFVNFFNKVTTGNQDSAEKYIMEFQFGWAVTNCEGIANSFGTQTCCPVISAGDTTQGLMSCVHRMVVRNISVNVTKGMFKYSIEGADLAMDAMTTRAPLTNGTDRNSMRLVPSIRRLFSETLRADVEFLQLDGACQPRPFEFRQQGVNIDRFDGPMGTWSVGRRNVIQAAYDWLSAHVSARGRGIIWFWRTDNVTRPTITFMETSLPTCENVGDLTAWNVGTYIVNGSSCLSPYTTVLCDKGWLQIQHIFRHKYNGNVACVDENGKLTWSKITNWYRNELSGRRMFKVSLVNSRTTNAGMHGAILTEDHPVLTKRGYVECEKLIPGYDMIHSGTMCPSDIINQIMIGTLLGDSYMRKKSYAYACGHCGEQLEYLQHKASLLGIESKIKTTRKSPNSCNMLTMVKVNGKATPYWRKMLKMFYPGRGKKVISEEILKQFSIISLAYLYMDDGNINKKKMSSIATCDFKTEEVDLLICKIRSLGIDCYRRPNAKYPRIHFKVEETKKLSKAIAPYVLPMFDYKLLPEDRNCEKIKINFEEKPFYDEFSISEFEPNTKWVYCIDVERFHNFVTHSGVVHNCSPVLSFSPTIKYPLDMAFLQTSGVQGGALDGHARTEQREPCLVLPNGRNQGLHATYTESDNTYRSFGKDATFIGGTNRQINFRANIPALPFEAEMRVQGDPTYDSPLVIQGGHYCSIVFINPFRVAKPNNSDDCVWLAIEGCNEQLSNSNWQIKKVFHEIKDGSFTTTLKLQMVPGLGATQSVSNKPLLG